jgi:hypothetical protein
MGRKYKFVEKESAGFVEKEEYWKYSSAIDFAGGKGLIELTYGY